MRSLWPILAVTAFVAAPLAARDAHAADCSSSVATCIDSEALWPTAGPTTFFSLPSARTTPKSRFGFGLASSLQHNPIVVRTSDAGPSGSVDVPVIGTQLTTSFLFSYGITERIEASFAAPVTFFQDGTGVSRVTQGPSTAVPSSAVRDVRIGLAYALLPVPRVSRPRGVFVVARLDVSIPSGDRDVFAGDRGFVGAPTLALEEHFGHFTFGASLGARLRKTTSLLGSNVGSQLFLGLGIAQGLDRKDRVALTAEAFALPTLVADSGSPYQWLVGVRWAPIFGGDFVIHGGGGGSMRVVGHAPIGEPIWRAVLDLRYAPLGNDSDLDGVLDRDDKCDDAREDRDGFQDDDGCPDPDNDKDGVLDAQDRCPDEPGTIENAGCPIVDRDADGVPDEIDKCPDQAGNKADFGCPAVALPVLQCTDGTTSQPGQACDVDHDGLGDDVDQCPKNAEDKDGIVDDDGCPEADADEDGIPDEKDKCPLVAETIDGVDDFDGCPEPGAHSIVTYDAGAIEIVDKPIRFAVGSSTVTNPMAAQLLMIAQKLDGLVDRGVEKVRIQAWADAPGDTPQNQKLAEKRADAIAAELEKLGIPAAIVKAQPGDLGDPPGKTKANYLVSVRTKRKEPLSKLPSTGP